MKTVLYTEVLKRLALQQKWQPLYNLFQPFKHVVINGNQSEINKKEGVLRKRKRKRKKEKAFGQMMGYRKHGFRLRDLSEISRGEGGWEF